MRRSRSPAESKRAAAVSFLIATYHRSSSASCVTARRCPALCNTSGSLAMLAAMRRALSRVSSLAAARLF